MLLPLLMRKKEEPKQPIIINNYYSGQPPGVTTQPPQPGPVPPPDKPVPEPPITGAGEKLRGKVDRFKKNYNITVKHPPADFKKPFHVIPAGENYPPGSKIITGRWKDPGHDKPWGIHAVIEPKG